MAKTSKTTASSQKSSEKLEHVMVPLHEKLSDKEKESLFKEYNVTIKELPKISVKDPAVRHLNAQIGDVIRITRESSQLGTTIYFRGVVDA